MFEATDNQKKLEELKIDDILLNAEDHITQIEPGLGGDGGDDFLKQFEVTDFKAEVSWDDIIPKEELDAIKGEEKVKEVAPQWSSWLMCITANDLTQEEEFLNEQIEMNTKRKRRGTANEEPEGRSAKRRAKELSAARIDYTDDEPDEDPTRPLNEREVRNLYRAYGRYGCLDECWDEIINDSGLTNRDSEVIKSTIAELVALSEIEIHRHRSILDDGMGKKEKKAILFDYKGTKKLNAETIVQRPKELKDLRKAVSLYPDRSKFRINDVKSVHNWSCEWGAREDAMLCVGIAKHGYGAWVAIRDDPELGMQGKFFLEEHRVDKKEERGRAESTAKSPGAVHLVRRADYLLSVLRERFGEASLINNHQNRRSPDASSRHIKRNGASAVDRISKKDRVSASASPVPNPKRYKYKSTVVITEKHRSLEKKDPTTKKHRYEGAGDREIKKRLKKAPAKKEEQHNGDVSEEKRPLTAEEFAARVRFLAVDMWNY